VVGKRVRDALYVHRSVVAGLAPELRRNLQQALAIAGDPVWNVARLEPQAVGLLFYPDFEEAAFPALAASTRVELSTGRVTRRSFEQSQNPLILHRKEQLVSDDHPQARVWRDLTSCLEAKGLFRESHRIGRRAAWMKLLADAGVRVEGHTPCQT
jgi:DNA phosphorothioation-associated putative methyltransferase